MVNLTKNGFLQQVWKTKLINWDWLGILPTAQRKSPSKIYGYGNILPLNYKVTVKSILLSGGKMAVQFGNIVRAENSAEPLIYDSDLESYAMDCAKRMVETPGWILPTVAATHPCKPGNDNQGENMLTETSSGFNKGELRYKWKHTTESW